MKFMTKFITRAYNRFEFNHKFGTITKLSTDSKLSDEIGYYNKIKDFKDVSKFFPRVFDSGISNDNSTFVELDYIDYSNLSDKMIKETPSCHEWNLISNQIYNILSEFASHTNYSNSDDTIFKYKRKMYLEKTLVEFEKFKDSSEKFLALTTIPKLTINGNSYKNFETIKDDLSKLIENVLITNEPMTIVHGDFCFGNILSSVNPTKNITSIKLIDPRGSWGEVGIFGDKRYDIAKLYHSFDGNYEYLTNDKFNIECVSDGNYRISFENEHMNSVKDIFESGCINKLNVDKRECKLIQGLIFVGMCARHYDSPTRQTTMYLTGIKILNSVLEQYSK